MLDFSNKKIITIWFAWSYEKRLITDEIYMN